VQKSLMPKGVDHRLRRRHRRPAGRVQKSLMPKGVDHAGGPKTQETDSECKNL